MATLQEKLINYWRDVRRRAHVSEDYNMTVNATDLNQETDWAKFSGNEQVDKVLFNIRRERRCEFIGEDMRWDDLIRWRSFDQFDQPKIYS